MPGANFQALLTHSPFIIQKGYGYLEGTLGGDVTMSYANVSGGSAPAAGDLITWIVWSRDTVATPIVDISGSGWAQSRVNMTGDGQYRGSILGKIATATDISSPALIVDNPTGRSILFWAAYHISNTATITANALSGNDSGPAPTDVTINSSALSFPDVAVTLTIGTSVDSGPVVTWTGATEDLSVTRTNFGAGTEDALFKASANVGGINLTISKLDEGYNSLLGGYIGVDF